MTLKQMEYFQKVVEKKNISSAADELYVSRSVVSRSIADIEEQFGAPLFYRSKNGVELTEYGRIVAQLFGTFRNSFDNARDRIAQLQREKATPILHIGVTPTNIYDVYRKYILPFQKAYPEIQLQVEEHNSMDACQLLADGKADILFLPFLPDSDIFAAVELYSDPIMLGVSAQDELSGKSAVGIADLFHLPLAFYNAPISLEDMLKSTFATFGQTPEIVLHTSNLMLLKELTQQKKVYPILPQGLMSAWEGVVLLPLDFLQPSINRIVTNHAFPITDEMQLFTSFVKSAT